MVMIFFDKKASGRAATLAWSEILATLNKSVIKNENISNKKLAEELHKPITRKFYKEKVHSPFTDNIWSADLDDM